MASSLLPSSVSQTNSKTRSIVSGLYLTAVMVEGFGLMAFGALYWLQPHVALRLNFTPEPGEATDALKLALTPVGPLLFITGALALVSVRHSNHTAMGPYLSGFFVSCGVNCFFTSSLVSRTSPSPIWCQSWRLRAIHHFGVGISLLILHHLNKKLNSSSSSNTNLPTKTSPSNSTSILPAQQHQHSTKLRVSGLTQFLSWFTFGLGIVFSVGVATSPASSTSILFSDFASLSVAQHAECGVIFTAFVYFATSWVMGYGFYIHLTSTTNSKSSAKEAVTVLGLGHLILGLTMIIWALWDLFFMERANSFTFHWIVFVVLGAAHLGLGNMTVRQRRVKME